MSNALGAVVAMAIGIVGTSTIHLSKGLMRQGLSGLQGVAGGRSRTIYATGVLMNFTNPLWVILANRFAPTVFYTSMYGLGLLPLLLFSRIALGERLRKQQYIGSMVILAGTLLVGAGNALGGTPSLYNADRVLLLRAAAGWLLIAPTMALLLRGPGIRMQEFLFGIAAGGLAALEAVIKGVSQAGAEANTLLPQSPDAWLLFTVSFVGAAGAFGMIQWSYLRGCRASMMGSIYDVAYVGVPLLLTTLIVENGALGALRLTGVSLLALGVLTVGRSPKPSPAASETFA